MLNIIEDLHVFKASWDVIELSQGRVDLVSGSLQEDEAVSALVATLEEDISSLLRADDAAAWNSSELGVGSHDGDSVSWLALSGWGWAWSDHGRHGGGVVRVTLLLIRVRMDDGIIDKSPVWVVRVDSSLGLEGLLSPRVDSGGSRWVSEAVDEEQGDQESEDG